MDEDLGRQLREAGASDAESPDLADLAAEIEALPSVKPRRAWLHESKWRLLRAFDEQKAKGESSSPGAEE